MDLTKLQEEEQGLVAVVSDVHFYEGILKMMCEGFYNRSGLYITGQGGPDEFTYSGYTDYLHYLKKSIETIHSIIKYIDDQKKYQKRKDSESTA
jgi:hypothetical protein